MLTLTRHLPGSSRRLYRTGRRPAAVLLVAVLVAVLVAALGACSGGDGSSSSPAAGSSDAGSSDERTGVAEVRSTDQDAALSEAGASDAPLGAAAETAIGSTENVLDEGVLAGRDVIRTATMSVVAKDLAVARTEVGSLMGQFGGVIASESTTVGVPRRGIEDDQQTMQLGLQVPAARFDATIDALATLGVVRERSIQTEDVTAAVADVDSRVESARAALDRVRALLTRANSLGTVIRLESVLSNRQADLESLVAQQRALAGQTQLATIQLELRTPMPTEPAPAEEDELSGFVDGLSEGWDALVVVVVTTVTTIGVLLPFALLLALLAAPALVWRRRREPGPADPVSPSVT